jgi:hypothetical protein
MAITRQRFVTGLDVDDMSRSQLRVATELAAELFNQTQLPILITTETRDTLDNAIAVIEATLRTRIGTGWGDREAFPVSIMARCHSNYLAWNGPVLQVWPTAEMLGRVDDMHGVTAQIVVPWVTSDHVDAWVAAHSPHLIGTAVQAPVLPRLSAAAISELKSLANFVNTNNGLATSTDRDRAIEVLQMLISFDPAFNRESVSSWLMSEAKWPSKMISRANKIMDDLLAGKKLKGSTICTRADWDAIVKRAQSD